MKSSKQLLGFLLLVSCLLPPASAVSGEYDKDIAKYQTAVERDPTNLDAAYQLGNCLAWDARYEEAIKVYDGILAKEPEYIDAEIGIARAYAWQGKQKEAIKKYEEILEKKPNSFEVYQGLGSIALWVNDFEKSIDYFNKALAINKEDLVSLKGIGRAYLGRGDRRRAEDYFTQAQILEIKKTPLPLILAITGGVFFLAFLAFLFIRSRIHKKKKLFLIMELKVLRYALALYHQKAGKYPLALEMLCREKWRPPGEKEDKPYLAGIEQGDRGFLIDPFGKRYWYNPDTGGVYSATRGCEEW